MKGNIINVFNLNTTMQDNLTAHKLLKHELVIFGCNYCDNRAIQQHFLTTRINSVLLGVMYD